MADDGMRDSGTNAASPGTSATNPDTNARLAAIRGRLECVGYLPWSATGDGRIEDSEGCVVGGFALRGYSRLAAAAPTDLAYLLGIAEAARELVAVDPYNNDAEIETSECRFCGRLDPDEDWSAYSSTQFDSAIRPLLGHADDCLWAALRRALDPNANPNANPTPPGGK